MARLGLAAALAAGLVVASYGTASAARPKPKPLFPVTVRAANGPVTIARRPQRIVSLSPTATENLFAVGARRSTDRWPWRLVSAKASPIGSGTAETGRAASASRLSDRQPRCRVEASAGRGLSPKTAACGATMLL
jgi:ABC-type Fe3+-hydroxamate transport system substrate-binding protein